MKAIIVKNDSLETIGLEIVSNDHEILFSWGISHNSLNWVKSIPVESRIKDVIALITMTQHYNDLDRFPFKWFEILRDNKDNGFKEVMDNPVKFQLIEDEKKQLNERILRIINSFG